MSAASLLKSPKDAKDSRAIRVDDSLFDQKSVVHQDTAGIDIGSETHYVSVPEDRAEPSVRTFGCFTPDITQWVPGNRPGGTRLGLRNAAFATS